MVSLTELVFCLAAPFAKSQGSSALSSAAQCLYPPSEAVSLNCIGINHTAFDEDERTCRKLRCMACVGLDERDVENRRPRDGVVEDQPQRSQAEACSTQWTSMCQYGKDLLNTRSCEAKCTQERYESMCSQFADWGEHDDTVYDVFRSQIVYRQGSSHCDVECRPRCRGESEFTTTRDGRHFCCEPGSYREREVAGLVVASCDGPEVYHQTDRYSCDVCDVQCSNGWRYQECAWQNLIMATADESYSAAARTQGSPALLPTLAVVVMGLRGATVQALLLSGLLLTDGVSALDSTPLDPLGVSIISAEHLAMLRGHDSEVSALSMVPLDMSVAVLATGTTDGSVSLWQLGSFDGQVMTEVRDGAGDAVNVVAAVAIDDSAVLAVGTDSGLVIFWSLTGTGPADLAVGVPSSFDAHSSRVSALCSVQSETHGPAIASGGFDGVVRFWTLDQPATGFDDLASSEVCRSSWPVVALEWVESWAALAVAGDHDEVALWRRSPSGSWVEADRLQEHTRFVRSLAFAPSVEILATLGQDQGLIAWHGRPSSGPGDDDLVVESVGRAAEAGLEATARGAVWLHGPEALATGSETGVLVWAVGDQAASPQRIAAVPMPGQVTALAWAGAPQEVLVVALHGSSELALVKFLSERCPDGSRPSSDFTGCQPCPAGSLGLLGVCELCPAGTSQPYLSGTRCEQCTAGRHQPQVASVDCRACSASAIQPAPGAASCETCADGSAASVDRLSCSACAAGRFGTGGLCETCPAGQFQPQPGQSSCDGPCDDGEGSDGFACVPCAPGTAGTGGVCLSCPWFHLATVTGQSACGEFCPPGEFADESRLRCLGFTPEAYVEIRYEYEDGANVGIIILVVLLVVVALVATGVLSWYCCCRKK